MKLEEYKEKYKSDRFYQEVFEVGAYQPVLEVKHDTVIDLGACAGEFSFWMNEKSKDIYAIEPLKEQFNEMVANIKDFGFDRVKPFNTAIGDRNRIGHMTQGSARGGSTLSVDDTPTEYDIEVKTLATFIKENNIEHVDILKVDIEEGEKQTFESEDFKDVADKISFIIGEHVGATSGRILGSFGFTGREYEYGYIFEK